MKKILMGVTGTAMVATATVSHAIPNSQITRGTKISEFNSTIKNTTIVNDIKITTEGTVEKFSKTTTKNLNYIPETSVPAKGNIVTSGTILKFNLNIILLGTHGKCQNIKNITASIDTKASYGLSKLTYEEQEELNSLIKSIKTTSVSVDNPNSESTIHLEPEIHFSNTDWNVEVNPTLKIKIILADGKVITNDIKLDKLLETNKYTNNVDLSSSLSKGASSGQYYINVSGGCRASGEDKLGLYNPASQTMQTITFKVHNFDPSQLKVTPLKIPGFTVNSNGTYTVTKALLDANKQLFEINTIGDRAIQGRVSLQPINVTMTSKNSNLGNDYNIAYTNKYHGSSIYIHQEAKTAFTMGIFSKKYQTKQNNLLGGNMSGVSFDTAISNNVPGKYKIYTGSLVSNGEILVKSSNYSYNLISNNQVYCHLNSSIVTELQSGTPAQKAKIMEAITSGDMTGIGVSYTGAELSKLMSEGKTVAELNFTYVEDNYNGRHTNIGGSYQTIPTDGNGKPVISRTITYGKLEGVYTEAEKKSIAESIANGQISSDGIIGTGANYQGFILSPLNYKNSYFDKNYIYPKVIRYGNYSHGVSSAYNKGYIYTGINVDNIGRTGESTSNSEPYDWLLKSHEFNLTFQGIGDGPELLTNNSIITVNMGHSFELVKGSSVTIDSGYITIPSSNIEIDGDKLIIKMTPAIAQDVGQAPTINFQAKYTNVGNLPNTINIQAGISGSNSSDGMIYKYNNKEVPAVQGGMPSISNYKTTVIFNYKNMNVGYHYILSTSGNTSILGDSIINIGNYSKTYYIAGAIPQEGTNGLADNLYCPNSGDLSTEMESINSHGAPVWVLPKSAVTLKDQELLTSPTGMDMKDALSYVESPSSGWIKYKTGMDLSNMIGYFVTPTVKGESAYSMSYNLKLTNINSTSSVPQAVNSAFKYYDATDSVGTVSNVVTMTPSNSNSQPTWFSNVNEIGGKLTKADLDNTIKFNGKSIALKDLIGSGYDEDNNWDNTPTKLMNKVILANDAKALKALGYKLVNITVDGKLRDLSWFNNIGIVNNTNSLTEVTFNIKKIDAANTTVDVVNSKGKIIYNSSTSNKIGTIINDSANKVVPKGYNVIKVTVNGSEVPQNKVPTTQSKGNQTIIYTVSKETNIDKNIEDKTYVQVIIKGSKEQLPPKLVGESAPGKTNIVKIPELPTGYKIESVTINGVITPINKNHEYKVTNSHNENKEINNHIVITVEPVKTTDTVKVVYEEGNKVYSTRSHTGTYGSDTKLTVPNIPNNYHVVSIMNSDRNITGLPTTFGTKDNTTIYTIAPNVEDKIYVGVKTINGKTLIPSKEIGSGYSGTNTNFKLPIVPKGYHLVKVLLNGNEITRNGDKYEFPAKYSSNETKEENYKVEIIVAKTPTTTIEEHYLNGTNAVKNIVTQNLQGAKVITKIPELPSGYRVIKITVNGKEVSQSEVPRVQSKDDQIIVYTIGKQPTYTVKVVMPDGTEETIQKVTGLPGSKVTIKQPTIPASDNLGKVTVTDSEGNVTSKIPTEFGNGDETIVYHLEKNPTSDIKSEVVVEKTGKVLVDEVTVASGPEDSAITVKRTTIPNGYHLVKVTYNGEVISSDINGKITFKLPTTIPTLEGKLVYYVAPNQSSVNKSTDKSVINKPIDKPKVNKPAEKKLEVNKSTSKSSKITTLPDTGISNDSNNVEKDLGAIAGVLSLISGVFLFRRKK